MVVRVKGLEIESGKWQPLPELLQRIPRLIKDIPSGVREGK